MHLPLDRSHVPWLEHSLLACATAAAVGVTTHALPDGWRSSSACSHPSSGVVERKAKRGWALGRLVSQEGMELDTVVFGSAGKRRRNDDNGNDRSCKRSAVMRVCTTGEGNGSDLGAGGSGNEASGGEMEYDGRVAGIGVSAGKEGDMGRSGQIVGRGGNRRPAPSQQEGGNP